MVGRDDRRSGTVAAFGRRSPVRRVCGRHVSNAATNRPRITIWHEPGRIGPPLDVGGFSFIDPPLADRNHTVWIFDHGSGLLVTADGFGIHHALAGRDLTTEGIDGGITSRQIEEFHRNPLRWLRFVDPVKLRRSLESIISEYDISYIAPIHGNPIAAADVDQYMVRLTESVHEISETTVKRQ